MYKSSFAALLFAVIMMVSSCSSAKEEQLKYNNDIITITEKADSCNTVYQNAVKNAMQSMTPEGATTALEAVTKIENDFKTQKANLAKIATPKFEDMNLKSSTDKWLDVQISGLAGDRAMLENIALIIKTKLAMIKATEAGEEPSAEMQAELERLGAINAENIKKMNDQEALETAAKNEIQANSEKFVAKYELKKK